MCATKEEEMQQVCIAKNIRWEGTRRLTQYEIDELIQELLSKEEKEG